MQPFPTFTAPSPVVTAPTLPTFMETSGTPISSSSKTDTRRLFPRNFPCETIAPMNIFQPISTGPVPKQIPTRRDHPAPRVNIVSISDDWGVIHLHKDHLGRASRSDSDQQILCQLISRLSKPRSLDSSLLGSVEQREWKR